MFEDAAVSPETEGASSGTKPDSGSQPASEGAEASNSAETSYTPEQLKQHWGAAQNQSVQNYQWGQAEQQKRMQLEARLAEIEGTSPGRRTTTKRARRFLMKWPQQQPRRPSKN